MHTATNTAHTTYSQAHTYTHNAHTHTQTHSTQTHSTQTTTHVQTNKHRHPLRLRCSMSINSLVKEGSPPSGLWYTSIYNTTNYSNRAVTHNTAHTFLLQFARSTRTYWLPRSPLVASCIQWESFPLPAPNSTKQVPGVNNPILPRWPSMEAYKEKKYVYMVTLCCFTAMAWINV